MQVVWELGDVTVADVVERSRPARHHNTIMTTMARLARKGFLTHYARDGRTYGYRPKVTREEVSRRYMELVAEQFFGGSVAATIAGFLGVASDGKTLSAKDAALLRRLAQKLEDENG
jgi:predicted transcriptional regulator